MAAVNVQLEVITRAGDPAQHLVENDSTQLFSLTTTDTAYTTDTAAYTTTVYNYYNSQVGAANVSTVETRWKVWVGGTAISGGVTTNEGVIGSVSSAADLKAELDSHISHALTGDQAQSGL